MLADSRRPTIRCLIVDDDLIIHALLTSFLLGEGFQVASAISGEEGVSQAALYRPHVIFMDIEMPGMNGFETTKRVRELRNTPAPVIVAFTSVQDLAVREACLDCGMDDYLPKPFSAEGMRTMLKRWVALQPVSDY